MTLLRRRLLAALIDGLLVVVAALGLSLLTAPSLISVSDPAGGFSLELLAAGLVLVVVPVALTGRTLGKRLAELRVSSLPGWQGRVRLVGKYLLVLGIAMLPLQSYLLLLLVELSAALTSGKRSVLDILLGSSVERHVDQVRPLHPGENSAQ